MFPIKLIVPNNNLDGSYHDRTGVPFPAGLIRNFKRLRLLENGVPIPAQFEVAQIWPDGSIKWASVDFAIKFVDQKPCSYEIDNNLPLVEIEENDKFFMIDTGKAKFEISKRYAAPVLGNELNGGPYLTDANENIYRPARSSTTEIVRSGPVCIELVSRGTYEHERFGSWHRFVVRTRAHAGATSLQIEHQTILTQDTRDRPIADIGFMLPVSVPQSWFAGVDGAIQSGIGRKLYVHQLRHDQVRLVADENETTATLAGKSDGWLGVRQNNGTVASVVLRDIWQRFPKELEFFIGKLVVHAWPKHGLETFSKEEELHPDNVWRLLWAHHGRLLDLGMPQDMIDTLNSMNQIKPWDHERGTVERATKATSVDVSITTRFSFDIRPYHKNIAPEIQSFARTYVEEPHAVSDPNWTSSSGALRMLDDLLPVSIETQEIDSFLHQKFLEWHHKWPAFASEYGMWIFGNTHTTTDPKRTPQMEDDKPDLHRLYQNSHYSHVSFPYMLYLRDPNPEVLRFARDLTRTWLDIGTTPDGQSRHCKSFVPWCVQKHVGTHYADSEAALIVGTLEGDSRGVELNKKWFTTFQRESFVFSLGRESINALAHVLVYYDAFHDPRAFEHIQNSVEKVVSRPWQEWADIWGGPSGTTFVMWNVRWLDRAYLATKDERLIARAKEFFDVNPDHAGIGTAMFLYETTQDASYLTNAIERVRTQIALPPGNSVFWRHFRNILNFAAKMKRAGIMFI